MLNPILVRQIKDIDGNLVAPYVPEGAIYDESGICLDAKLKDLNPLAIKEQLSGAQETISALTSACTEQIQAITDDERRDIDNMLNYLFPLKPQFVLNIAEDDINCEISYVISGISHVDVCTPVEITPDNVTISKKMNGGDVVIYESANTSSDIFSTQINSNIEEYTLTVSATTSGYTVYTQHEKLYYCAYGSHASSNINDSVFNSLEKTFAKGLNANPVIETKSASGEYIWIIVPNELSINKVTAAGFTVSMEAPISYNVTGLCAGNYKAYRSSKALTPHVWNLVLG